MHRRSGEEISLKYFLENARGKMGWMRIVYSALLAATAAFLLC